MIYVVLSSYARDLSCYLSQVYRTRDDLVSLTNLGENIKNQSDSKLILSLVNVERDVSSGISFNYKSVSSSRFKKTMPGWQLNLYVLIVAAFTEKQYEEGLRILSGALTFIQNNNTFSVSGIDTPLSIEPVNLSFNELSNLWSISGGSYLPSVLCKIRMLPVDSDQIKTMVSKIDQNEVKV